MRTWLVRTGGGVLLTCGLLSLGDARTASGSPELSHGQASTQMSASSPVAKLAVAQRLPDDVVAGLARIGVEISHVQGSGGPDAQVSASEAVAAAGTENAPDQAVLVLFTDVQYGAPVADEPLNSSQHSGFADRLAWALCWRSVEIPLVHPAIGADGKPYSGPESTTASVVTFVDANTGRVLEMNSF